MSLEGEGSQVFRCVIDSKGGYWHFEQAEADLFDKNGELKATQSGPMMAFDHVDGSRVISSHIVAWLNPANPKKDLKLALLKASSDSGNGTLNGVKYIQRLNTQGGIPAGTCSTAGEFLRVPFKADYVFWK